MLSPNTCDNPKCHNMVKYTKLYCSKTCGDSVRHQRARDRKKRGVLMVDCSACNGAGKVELVMRPRPDQV